MLTRAYQVTHHRGAPTAARAQDAFASAAAFASPDAQRYAQ